MNLENYKKMLKAHDWMYQWADDARIFNAGHREHQELKRTQQTLDPDFEIWDQFCHPEYRRKDIQK